MNIEIKLDGLAEAARALAAMAERSAVMAPLMGQIGEAMIASVHENFDVEGRPKWKPLSASTVVSYQAAAVQKAQNTQRWQNSKNASTRSKIEANRVEQDVGGHKILVQTGELRQSIMLGVVTNESVEIGSSLPYARVHQLGHNYGPVTITPKNKQALAIPTANGTIIRRSASIPARTLPARPYLSIQEDDKVLIAGLTIRHIREGMG